MTIEDTQPFQEGVTQASADSEGKDAAALARELADVKRWTALIREAREFDKHARTRYALDRRYARADRTHFEVTVPIAQSYIDVMRSFLYARDPDVDVSPSGLTQPPPQKEIMAMVAKQQPGQTIGSPATGLPPALAQVLGTVGGQPPSDALPGGPPPTQLPTPPTQTGSDPDSVIQQQAASILAPYQQLRDDAKQLSATLELVISALWKKAKLKDQAKPLVGSALTVGIGWMKACWLERMGRDPVIQQQIDDIQENLARMAALKREINEGEGDEDANKAELEQQAQALEARVEVVVARGLAIDFVAAEDIQVSTDCRDLSAYLDASWIAHRVFMPLSQAQRDYPAIADQLKSAIAYYPVVPRDSRQAVDTGAMASDVSASEADAYRKGGEGGSITATTSDGFVCLWEVWNHDASNVLTFFEGVNRYAKEPYAATPATSRFYPFFQYQIGNVSGERHPRSLITRSERLFDEYDSVRSGYRRHRRRAIPKTAFDATNYSAAEVAKLEAAETGEMVGIKPTRPGEPISNALAEIKYPAVDMALYDTGAIRAELEMIWGIQEALSSSIHTPKTLGEAEIQQQGTQSRQGYMRDDLDAMFSDLAQYTGEVALQVLDQEDVKAIAGPWSLWPQGMTIEDITAMVTVSIHAGSSGKPDTTAQRQAWSTILPVLQSAVQQVGQLRGSSPDEIADCVEALIIETVNRTGDRVDASAFLPDPPRTPPPPPKPPMPPVPDSALMGPQIVALTAVLVDVRAGALTADGATALIQAACPAVPVDLVHAMVAGSLPQPHDPATQLEAPHASTVPPPDLSALLGANAPGATQPIDQGAPA